MSTTLCPLPLLGANPNKSSYELFKRQFQNYITICGATAAQQLPLLLNAVGQDGLILYDGLPNPKETLDDAFRQFDQYFTGSTSTLLRRKSLMEAKQLQSETITTYANRLRKLGNECNYGANLPEMLRDVFCIGVRNDRLAEKLLVADAATLTFDKAVSIGESVERAYLDRRGVTSDQQARAIVTNQHPLRKSASSSQQSSDMSCYRCGGGHMAGFPQCPAINSTCRSCGKRGHFAKVCTSSAENKSQQWKRTSLPPNSSVKAV